MTIKRSQTLTPDERATLLEWDVDIFRSEALGLIWRPKELHLVFYDEGVPVSKCSLLRHTIEVNGNKLDVAGLGGVVTAPQFQQRGYATSLLEDVQLLVDTEWMLPAITLFCRDGLVPFYLGRGWQVIAEPVEILQPHGSIIAPMNFMVLMAGKHRWPKGSVKLLSLPW